MIMPMISSRIVLVDRFGEEWVRGPEYQDWDAVSHGWLQMQGPDGIRATLTNVVALYGIDGPEGPYLKVKDGTYP